MDKKVWLKEIFPHFVAVVLFFIISYLYCSPVFEGKHIMGHDSESWHSMAKETLDYNEANDDVTLWTNSMFGGMPTYQIAMRQPYNFIQYVEKIILLNPSPVFYIFLYLLCFYCCALAFRLNPWLSIIASLAFTFASYNFIIIVAGHGSKAITIAYMAPLIGSIVMAFRGKRLLGTLLTAIFLSLAIRANHVQILYYTIFILLIFAIVEFVYSIKDKELKSFFKTAGMLIAAAVVAIGMNATSLLTTAEYSQYTMRGKSNGLTTDTQNSQDGLSKEYITQWSYGIDETMTVLIPNFKGGASGVNLDGDSETGKRLKSMGVASVDRMLSQMPLPLYWGTQPFTSGPVYLGAVICFLFVLGLFIVDAKVKWWLVPTIVLTLMLSWGHNFMWLTDIFIDNVPLYNKFRTVSMTLVATGFCVALLGVLALKKVLDPSTDKQKLIRPITISAAIVGGLALLFALIPSLAGDFTSPSDAQLQGDYAFLRETLPLDRKAMLQADAWRSVALVVAIAGLLFLYVKNLLKLPIIYVLLATVVLVDMYPVAKRYFSNADFKEKRTNKTLRKPTPADTYILNDKSYHRTLDATVNIFNDASPSYFHKNVGGYHAAKLRRYQELINMQLGDEINEMFGLLNATNSIEEIDEAMDALGVLNMLNMKYLIYNKEAAPFTNPSANGNAWFVSDIHIAQNADEEMYLVGEIDTKKELVVDKEFAEFIPSNIVVDPSAQIALTHYQPNKLRYHVNAATDQFAVFSEIYYDKGWNAYVNGEKVPYIRANYLLRAMPLKAGDYELEFRFEPDSYRIGNIIALLSSIVLILSVLIFVFLYWKKEKVTAIVDNKNSK